MAFGSHLSLLRSNGDNTPGIKVEKPRSIQTLKYKIYSFGLWPWSWSVNILDLEEGWYYYHALILAWQRHISFSLCGVVRIIFHGAQNILQALCYRSPFGALKIYIVPQTEPRLTTCETKLTILLLWPLGHFFLMNKSFHLKFWSLVSCDLSNCECW